MNKKGFLFSFLLLISCFFCIGKVSAISSDVYNMSSWIDVSEFTLPNGVSPDTHYILICEGGGIGYRIIYFSKSNNYTVSIESEPETSPSFPNLYSIYVYSGNSEVRVSSSYTGSLSNKKFPASTSSKSNFSVSKLIYTNINLYYRKYQYKGIWFDLSKVQFTLPTYTVNFHLNGGFNIDMSDISDWQRNYNDYSVSLTSDELHDYISHLTFLKSNHDFEGLYYDSDFTQPYSSTDTIDSDIDLYAKWKSKIINVNDIDYIEFKFDDILYTATNFSYDFHFKTVTSDGQDETIQFSQPFGREYYTGCDDNGQNCTTDVKFKDSLFYDLDHISYDYTFENSLTFNSSPDHITNSYSVIVPLENVYGTYLYYDFNSEQDYEMIIHYKDDEDSTNSYLRTVDITGKYGAIFLPLYDNSAYVDEGSYYLTRFKVIGNVDIQVTDSRDMTDYNILQIYSMNYCNSVYDNQTDIPYDCNHLTGVFDFKIDNLTAKQTLRFVNHAYTELSERTTSITYDTRYFNYGVLDSPYSVVDIEDPTTHEIERVGLSEFYNQLNKESIGNSKLTFQISFNRFVEPIKFIFRQVTKLYGSYLNGSIQHYFFLVFSLTIVILIIRVIF